MERVNRPLYYTRCPKNMYLTLTLYLEAMTTIMLGILSFPVFLDLYNSFEILLICFHYLLTGEAKCSRRLFLVWNFLFSTQNFGLCHQSRRWEVVKKLYVVENKKWSMTAQNTCLVAVCQNSRKSSTRKSHRREKVFDDIWSHVSTA